MLRKRASINSNEVYFSDEEPDDFEIHEQPKRSENVKKNSIALKKTKKKTRNLVDLYHDEIRTRFRENKSCNKPIDELIKSLNSMFLNKQYEEAIKVCYDIIHQSPNLPEPFNVLHLIYEELGDKKKSVDCMFIKTQLERNKSSEVWQVWEDLAHRYFSLEEFKSAAYCYKRAFKNNIKNNDLILLKAECHEKLGDLKLALYEYEKYLKCDFSNVGLLIKISKLYGCLNKKHIALKILIRHASSEDFCNKTDFNVLNMILDLFLQMSKPEIVTKFLELFVLDNHSYLRFCKNLTTSLEHNDLKFFDLHKIQDYSKQNSSENILSYESIYFFIQNYPIDISFAYVKGLIGSCQLEKYSNFVVIFNRKTFSNHEDTWEEFLKSINKTDNEQFTSNEFKKIEGDFFEDLSKVKKIIFLNQQAIFYNQQKNSKAKTRCLLKIYRLDSSNIKAKLKLCQSWKRKKETSQAALNMLNLDENASRRTAKMNYLDDNLSAFSLNESTFELNIIPNQESNDLLVSKMKSKIITKLTMLKLFNQELIKNISSLINQHKIKNEREKRLLQHERIKLYNENQKTSEYFKELKDFVFSNLQLEIERKELSKKLKSKLMLESYKEVFRSILALKIKGKGLLSKKQKQITREIKNYEQDDSGTLLFTKKKFFIQKLVSFFMKEIFSVVEFISFSLFYGYFNELLSHFYCQTNYKDCQTLLILMTSFKPRQVSNFTEFCTIYLKKYTIDYLIGDFEHSAIDLRQIIKSINLLTLEEIKIKREEVESILEISLAHFNNLLSLMHQSSNTLSSYVHKVLKILLKKLELLEESKILKKEQTIKFRSILYLTIGNMYFTSNSFELAVRNYQKCAEVCPKNKKHLTDFMMFLCHLLKTKSRTNENTESSFKVALNFFQLYTKVESNKDVCVYNLGRALSAIGDFENAVILFEKVIENQKMNKENECIFLKSALNLYSIYNFDKNEFMMQRTIQKHLTFE